MDYNWNDIFIYKPNGELWWRECCPGRKMNRPAGSKHPKGYIDIKVGGATGRLYRAHRIVWEMFNGPIPDGYVINHINGVRWDNRIENLECVLPEINNSVQKRVMLCSNNKTGISGVNYRFRCGRHIWNATFHTLEGGEKFLGEFDNFFDACCARKSAENRAATGEKVETHKRLQRNNTSGIPNILYRCDRNKPWVVDIVREGIHFNKSFSSEEEARVYLEEIKSLFD